MTDQPAAATLLKIVRGSNEGTEFPLDAKQKYVVGRSTKAQICVSDVTVSHRHALVENVNGIWFVSDTGSRHGTFVNKQQISGRKALFDRDVIRVGKTLLEFREYERLSQADVDEIDVAVKVKDAKQK